MKITSPKHTWFVCILPSLTSWNTTLDIICSSFHPLPHSFLWRCTIGIFRALRSPEYVTLFWLLGSWNVFLVGHIRKLGLCIDDLQKPDLRGCKIARRMYASFRSFSTELYRSAKWEKKTFSASFHTRSLGQPEVIIPCTWGILLKCLVHWPRPTQHWSGFTWGRFSQGEHFGCWLRSFLSKLLEVTYESFESIQVTEKFKNVKPLLHLDFFQGLTWTEHDLHTRCSTDISTQLFLRALTLKTLNWIHFNIFPKKYFIATQV